TGHTIILIGDKNGEFHEKLKYFKEQDNNTAGFPIFGEIYGYTDFMITSDGKRVPGFSLVLKHAIEWHNAMLKPFSYESFELFDLGRQSIEKMNKNYVHDDIIYYKKDDMNISIKTSEMFKYKYKDQDKETFLIKGEYLKDKTQVYCVSFEQGTDVDEVVYCLEEMYKDSRISLLFDKIVAF
ncbi:7899_t:CDS:1, partial [Cetraspora pellucida]